MWAELLSQLQLAYENGGKLGLAAAGVTLGLRLFRDRAPKTWKKLPWYAKAGLPVLATTLASVLAALASGGALLPALLPGLLAGLGSIGLHHGTKGVRKVPGVELLAKKTLDLMLPPKKK